MSVFCSWHDTGGHVKGWFLDGAWEATVLNLTSQRWLSPEDVDCSIWTHHLLIVKPAALEHWRTMLFVIGDHTNLDLPPKQTDELLLLAASVAVRTKSLAMILYQIPNQPCHFKDDTAESQHSEDDLIAYTWAQFLKHPDRAEWLAQLPMTKAVVRAMDAAQSFCAQIFSLQVDSFVVVGASKRGWITWTAAAVDKRVVGIVPIVMDALSFRHNLHHFYKALGGWPFAFEPYVSFNITAQLDSLGFKQLVAIIDPIVYKERLTMPKLVVTTSNDEFFLLDDSSYFWNELEGEKYLLILSNTDHSLFTGLPKLLKAVKAFYLSIVSSFQNYKPALASFIQSSTNLKATSASLSSMTDRPRYWWSIDRDEGILRVMTADKPYRARLWYAYNGHWTKKRDFRWFCVESGSCGSTIVIKEICFQPIFFFYKNLRPVELEDALNTTLTYVARIPFPKEGYGAFYVELEFTGQFFLPYVLTTEAVIIPNTFPYKDCFGVGCRGTLV
ncbi:hypothetical protein O6H91_12G017200 [Diphasiastrum complanatum]|uniref:Uncharacterized protein n=1 Tax=Diphasiastrum complanatum TaxID=34168 RepID=A0ACC2BZ43_DIPCM|nr:hypothetical protein O6H91_12G017200 [Diphasiastrum complanatum]